MVGLELTIPKKKDLLIYLFLNFSKYFNNKQTTNTSKTVIIKLILYVYVGAREL